MGDKKNAIKKLQQSLKSIKYPYPFEIKEIDIGSPKEYLKLYHYLFLDYNPLIANEILTKHQLELNSKNDKSFIDGVYKILRDMFDYVPKLTKDQLFTTSYAQVKALMACDIVHLIQQKLRSLQPVSANSCIASSSMSLSLSKTAPTSMPLITKKTSKSQISVDQNNEPSHSVKSSLNVQNHLNTNASKNPTITKTNTNTNINLKTNPSEFNSNSKANSFEPSLEYIANYLNQFNSKFVEITQRLIPIESRLNNLMHPNQNECFPPKQASPRENNGENEFVQITRKEYENLLSRITVLETQHLLNKNLSLKNNFNEIDKTVDESQFHSILNFSNQDDETENDSELFDSVIENINNPVKSSVCQGSAVDFENQSIYSNCDDTTPTLISSSKTSKFTNNNDTESSSDLTRAKELLLRASALSKDISSNIKSM